MSDNFAYLGGSNGYVPQLHADLMVAYLRNPAKFKINKYINVRKVEKQIGYYVNWKNDGQVRITDQDTFLWADGADAPMNTQQGDQFDFKQFNCVRRVYGDMVGYLAVEQGSWDVLANTAAQQSMRGMTARTQRIATTLTTSGNYPSTNVIAAVATGGATWAAATSALPSILKTIQTASNLIQQSTLGVVQGEDLYVVINPNNAQTLSQSAEFIDYLKQSPTSIDIWRGDLQFMQYNVPSKLFGVNVIVEDAVYTSNLPGATRVTAYCFPDNYAVVLSKPQGISGFSSSAFSSFELFCYQDMETFIYNDIKNRRYDVQITENVDDSFLFAPNAAVLIQTNS